MIIPAPISPACDLAVQAFKLPSELKQLVNFPKNLKEL
jgi:hypothetical protein